MKKIYRLIFVFVVIGLLAPMISNQSPLMLIRSNQISFPFLDESTYVSKANDFVIMPIIPFSPGVSDFENADYKSPFASQYLKNNSLHYRHWLGTTLRGCDVLSGIIHGTRYALIIGFFSALLSLIIGVFLGASILISKDGSRKISIFQLVLLIVFIITVVNCLLFVQANLIFRLFVICFTGVICYFLARIQLLNRFSFSINYENLELQLNVLFSAVPRLFFVVAIMGVFNQGMWILIFLLGVTGWMEISRMIRAELKRIQELDYYAAAQLSGANRYRITMKQILPNLLPLIISVFAFSFAGAIFSEASLSFLGWGIGPEKVTWGSLIMEGKDSMSAWWLIVFPGICLSTCIYILISLARKSNNDIYSL